MERVICLLIGYACGIFQTGYIYGRLHGIDIRQEGSGNAGTTNVLRTLGKKAGIITYAGDMLKVVISSVIIRLIYGESFADSISVLVLYGGLGAILGHNYPFYLGFRGGKGIAASSGVMIALLYFPIMIINLVIFVAVTAISKYVSLGSLVMMAALLIEFIIFGSLEMIPGLLPGDFLEATIIVAVLAVLAFWRHRANIVRLVNGTERKIGEKKKDK